MNKRLVVLAALFSAAVWARAEERPREPLAKQPGVAADRTRRKAMTDALRGDPARMELIGLRETLRVSANEREKAALRKRINELRVKREAAVAEAELTPEQRAGRAERARKKEAMRAELAPWLEKLRAAKTGAEREPLIARILELKRKYP